MSELEIKQNNSSEVKPNASVKEKLQIPYAVLCELTHRCPLSCPYCSNPVELEMKSKESFVLVGLSSEKIFQSEKKICAEVISEIGASSLKDMGKVMGELKKKHADEIDFAKAGPLIKQLLSG